MTNYALDKANGKMLGVCAGIARWGDVDPTLVRISLVLLTLLVGPLAILAYLLTALIAENR